jgi:hypothetical protein
MVSPRSVLDNNQKKRRKKKRDAYREDRITGLPDDILAVILSQLTFKEATATSILSRRWRYQWSFMNTHNLSFDSGKPLCDKAFQEQTFLTDIYKYRAKFVGWVNHVLTNLHQRTTVVDKFRICFSLGSSYSSNLDKWVRFALLKAVAELELNLTNFDGFSQQYPYGFPSVEKLSRMRTPLSFTRLTSIRLMNVDVSEQVVEYLLAECSSLEHLCVVRSNAISNLKICGGELLKLKRLEMYRCKPMENFEISAPNLVSLSYTGPKTEIPFKKVPLLSELFLGDEFCDGFIFEAPKHSVYFSMLEKLTLVLPPSVSETDKFPRRYFPKMLNLKQLELRIGIPRGFPLDDFTVLIEAAPSLAKFVMKLVYVGAVNEDRYDLLKYYPRNSNRDFLKEVEIVGFIGYRYDYEVIEHMFRYTVALERITIDTRNPGFMWGPDAFCDTFADLLPEDRTRAQQRAEDLRSKLPPGAEFFVI